jgi:hypothetical protein
MRLPLLAAALFVPTLAACLLSHNDPQGTSPPAQNDQPLTVVVDTGQTMSHVVGGQGVGVFVQYTAGGHWKVRWTCDTALSGLPCDFAITITGPSIANAKSAFDPSETKDSLDSSTPDQLVVTAHTTSAVDELDFDAEPGKDVKVDSAVSGLRDGAFFFFVQNGQIDGNFPTTKLTDPLVFEPSTP